MHLYQVIPNHVSFNDVCLGGRLGQESLQCLQGMISTHIGPLSTIQTHLGQAKLAKLEESQQQKWSSCEKEG